MLLFATSETLIHVWFQSKLCHILHYCPALPHLFYISKYNADYRTTTIQDSPNPALMAPECSCSHTPVSSTPCAMRLFLARFFLAERLRIRQTTSRGTTSPLIKLGKGPDLRYCFIQVWYCRCCVSYLHLLLFRNKRKIIYLLIVTHFSPSSSCNQPLFPSVVLSKNGYSEPSIPM